jgi:hypothetical protein
VEIRANPACTERVERGRVATQCQVTTCNLDEFGTVLAQNRQGLSGTLHACTRRHLDSIPGSSRLLHASTTPPCRWRRRTDAHVRSRNASAWQGQATNVCGCISRTHDAGKQDRATSVTSSSTLRCICGRSRISTSSSTELDPGPKLQLATWTRSSRPAGEAFVQPAYQAVMRPAVAGCSCSRSRSRLRTRGFMSLTISSKYTT